ncbi:hypothetical protein BRC93_03900 [Halobacteriales archaeon QS_5_70_15]|nr:MAG: hypothetical protein BRC93_03900 [Halobacteriales archaeon QS_5_70_15]
MSVSRHPIALRLESRVGDGTKLLATVMALPLIDGIFPALILAGAVDSALGILEVGLLIFGGSATLAVVLAEMEGTRREQIQGVLLVGLPLLVLAGLEAAVAPTIESMLRMEIFTRFAALVILAVAAKTASATIGEYLPRPGAVILLGLVASLDPSNVAVTFVTDPMLVARGVAAAGVGVGFALSVAVLGPWLRGTVDLDRFRFGSAVALGVLPFSILGPIDAPIALAVLAVTSLLAFDPDGRGDPLPAGETAGPVADGGDAGAGAGAEADRPTPESRSDTDDDRPVGPAAEDRDSDDDSGGSHGISDGDRAPWL